MDTQDCGPEVLSGLPDEEVESGGGKVTNLKAMLWLFGGSVAMTSYLLTVRGTSLTYYAVSVLSLLALGICSINFVQNIDVGKKEARK